MTLILDRTGRLRALPSFLSLETLPPRWGRTAAFLALAVPAAGLAAVLTGLVITLAAAIALSRGSHLSLPDAIGALTNSARSPRSLISYGYELSVAGLSSYAAAVVALWIAARLYKRPLRSFITAAPRFRWRVVAAGAAVGFPLVGLAFALESLAGSPGSSPPILAAGATVGGRAAYFAFSLAFLYLAAFAEEALFRGWLLQQYAPTAQMTE